MEKARQPGKPMLNRRNYCEDNGQQPQHLKPLSPYYRPIAGDPSEGSLDLFRNIPSPFAEMVVKNIIQKRKLDDSCLDDSYETPAKKPYIPSTASPDLGLGGGSFNVETPKTVSQELSLERQKAIRRQTKDAFADVKSHLNLSSSSETRIIQSDCSPPNDVVSKTNSSRLLPDTVNCGNVFDIDIDTFFGLSPVTCNAGGAIGAANNDCLCARSNGPLAPIPTAGQQVGEGKGRPSAGWKSDGNRASSSADAAVEDNSGHDPHGFLQFLKEVGGSSQPLFKPLQLCQVRTASLEGNSDFRDVLGTSSAPSGPSRAVREALEVNVGMGIGAPILESTICNSENVDLVEEHTVENSFEDSLPLQVQVKSVVVVMNSQAPKRTTPALPQKSKRPMAFYSEGDWYRKKRHYMDSVARHIQENPFPDTAVTELGYLMDNVAEQLGDLWTHPSDLTTRNHQQRFGNERPRMSLAEWKAQSSRTHQGFSKVPKIFQRSPVP